MEVYENNAVVSVSNIWLVHSAPDKAAAATDWTLLCSVYRSHGRACLFRYIQKEDQKPERFFCFCKWLFCLFFLSQSLQAVVKTLTGLCQWDFSLWKLEKAVVGSGNDRNLFKCIALTCCCLFWISCIIPCNLILLPKKSFVNPSPLNTKTFEFFRIDLMNPP